MVVALGEFGRTPKIGLITQNGMTEKTGARPSFNLAKFL